MSSSRPVKLTGWKERKLIFFGLSRANSMMRPTCSLLMPLTMVVTGTMSTPASCRLWMAWSFTSNALPTLRCGLDALPIPSHWGVGVAETSLSGCLGELLRLGELDAVGRGLNGGVTNFAGIRDRVEEVWAECGLA